LGDVLRRRIVGAGPLTAPASPELERCSVGCPPRRSPRPRSLAAGRRQSPRPRGFSKHVVGEQAQIPAASMVDRAARVQRHPLFAVLEVAERMPIVRANELVRVAVLIEQAGDLLMIDRLPVVRRARPLMATRRGAVQPPRRLGSNWTPQCRQADVRAARTVSGDPRRHLPSARVIPAPRLPAVYGVGGAPGQRSPYAGWPLRRDVGEPRARRVARLGGGDGIRRVAIRRRHPPPPDT
jgi:hypothetical protein